MKLGLVRKAYLQKILNSWSTEISQNITDAVKQIDDKIQKDLNNFSSELRKELEKYTPNEGLTKQLINLKSETESYRIKIKNLEKKIENNNSFSGLKEEIKTVKTGLSNQLTRIESLEKEIPKTFIINNKKLIYGKNTDLTSDFIPFTSERKETVNSAVNRIVKESETNTNKKIKKIEKLIDAYKEETGQDLKRFRDDLEKLKNPKIKREIKNQKEFEELFEDVKKKIKRID